MIITSFYPWHNNSSHIPFSKCVEKTTVILKANTMTLFYVDECVMKKENFKPLQLGASGALYILNQTSKNGLTVMTLFNICLFVARSPIHEMTAFSSAASHFFVKLQCIY